MPVRKESWISNDGREFPDEHSALVYESLTRKADRIKELLGEKLLLVGDTIRIKTLVENCYVDEEFRNRFIGLLMYGGSGDLKQ